MTAPSMSNSNEPLDRPEANPNYIEMSTAEACRVKWEAGQKIYGKEFVGHPLVQLDEELIDALNYIDEAERWGIAMGDCASTIRAIRDFNQVMYLKCGVPSVKSNVGHASDPGQVG